MTISIHKEIGYDIMQYFHDVFTGSRLVDINEAGCYQKLFLLDGSSIHYTKWRSGTMPFYIILYNKKGKYIFEMDLSMLLFSNELFTWHLKKPQNKATLQAIMKLLGGITPFSTDYVTEIKKQKSAIKSGVNTPKNGFNFIIQATWKKSTKQLTELVISVFDTHGIQVAKIDSEEGDNDDGDFINQKRRVRRGQRKLKLKLLQLYDFKCAITGFSPTEVLEAAHIVGHAKSGINHSENGILLRSDIHSLFDSNLLRIEPEELTIVLALSLKTTPYWELNGKVISERIDGSSISKAYLKERWDSKNL